MVIRHMQKNKKNRRLISFWPDPPKRFVQNIYDVLTWIIDPRLPPVTAIENKKVDNCKTVGFYEIKEDARKKEEHLYPVKSPETLSSNTLSLPPIKIFSLNNFLKDFSQLIIIFLPCWTI